MKSKRGAGNSRSGTYLDMSTGEFIRIDANTPLPERASLKKVPGCLVLLAGPIIGVAYIIFLPLAAIVAAPAGLVIKARRLATAARHPSQEPDSSTVK